MQRKKGEGTVAVAAAEAALPLVSTTNVPLLPFLCPIAKKEKEEKATGQKRTFLPLSLLLLFATLLCTTTASVYTRKAEGKRKKLEKVLELSPILASEGGIGFSVPMPEGGMNERRRRDLRKEKRILVLEF